MMQTCPEMGALVSHPASKAEILRLLTCAGEAQQALFRAARAARLAAGADAVKLRGVIEISNYCQKHCDYCALRPQNKEMVRYRMDVDTILAITEGIVAEGITTVFLQSGQDPKSDDIVFAAIPRIRALGVNILLNLGEKSRETYSRYFVAGADSYILKFETSDPDLYQKIVGSPLAKRLECARWIREVGMKLGTGNIIGLPGQTLDTLVEDILLAREMQPDFVSSSPFIPNENTPLESLGMGDLQLTLNSIAICRLLFPNALIPAVSALEKIRKGGQLLGLKAGANVLTINFTPKDFRDKYAIYSKERFVVSLDHARATISGAGLQVR
jgi:biotin synthase